MQHSIQELRHLERLLVDIASVIEELPESETRAELERLLNGDGLAFDTLRAAADRLAEQPRIQSRIEYDGGGAHVLWWHVDDDGQLWESRWYGSTADCAHRQHRGRPADATPWCHVGEYVPAEAA